MGGKIRVMVPGVNEAPGLGSSASWPSKAVVLPGREAAKYQATPPFPEKSPTGAVVEYTMRTVPSPGAGEMDGPEGFHTLGSL